MDSTKMNPISPLCLVGVLVLLIYIGFFVSWFVLRKEVKLDRVLFLTEYAKFLPILTIATLSFITIHFFLEMRKMEQTKLNLFNGIIKNIYRIYFLLQNHCNTLERYCEEGNPEGLESVDIQMFFLNNVEQIEKVNNSVASLIEDQQTKITESNTDELFIFYQEEIFPRLKYLLDEGKKTTNICVYFKAYKKELIELNIKTFKQLQLYSQT